MLIIYLSSLALLVGSFLNMLIDRLHTKEQIIGVSRSHCDTCGHILGVRDLVPIVSWLMLRGKCRYCGAPIPVRNTLVELITAALVVLAYVELFESNLESIEEIPIFVLVTIILCALLVLLVFDVYHQILPDSVTVVALLATIVLHGFSFVENGILFGNISFMNSMLSAFGSALPYFILILITKGAGMGGGDLKLAFVMGLLLGYPKIFVAQYLAFILGGIVAIVLLMGGKKRFGQTMAFGPFMIIGTYVVLFWGDEIIKRFAYWIP